MKQCDYPVGEPKRLFGATFKCPITKPEELRALCRGYISCKVLAPGNLFLPVLPYRSDKLMFALCKSKFTYKIILLTACAEECCQEKCKHNDEERALYGTWTTVELEVALEKGYRILEVYGAVHFDNWSTDLFSNYINTFLKEKQVSLYQLRSNMFDYRKPLVYRLM